MKEIVFYITHKTLELEHAELTFGSFERQNCDKSFHTLYIYNSHEDELSNETLLELAKKYNLKKFFSKLKIY